MNIQLLIVIIIVLIGPTLTSVNLSHAADGNISESTTDNSLTAAANTSSCPTGGNCISQETIFFENAKLEQVNRCSTPPCDNIVSIEASSSQSGEAIIVCSEETCTNDIRQLIEFGDNIKQENVCQDSNPSCVNVIRQEMVGSNQAVANSTCSGQGLCTNLLDQSFTNQPVGNQENNCSGSQTCENVVFQRPLAAQSANLLNNCETTECSNRLTQKVLPNMQSNAQNTCSGTRLTSCTNEGTQGYILFNAADLQNSCSNSLRCDNTLSQVDFTNQVQNQLNDCRNADCINNSSQIATAENSFSQINGCSEELNMPCGTNTNQEKLIDQKSDQTNKCFESTCTSTVVENASLNNAASSAQQESVQYNGCLKNSQCENQGVLEFVGVNTGDKGDQSLNQNNLCINESNCINNGSVKVGSGSNTQSNTCIKDSSCSNTGVNNENICVKGATCDNSGTNSKIISIGDPCENKSTDTKVICTNGRIITRPS